jgi:hypothetical protein
MRIMDEAVSNELDSTPDFRISDGLTTERLTCVLTEGFGLQIKSPYDEIHAS